jgi:hypothetical protein
MGFRFRRSFRIAPGIRLNTGLRGASVSIGRRGASLNVGTRGVRATVGLPGTGLSYTAASGTRRLGKDIAHVGKSNSPGMDVKLRLQSDGNFVVLDVNDDTPLAPELLNRALAENRVSVKRWLEEKAEEINADVLRTVNIHLGTPPPVFVSPFSAEPYPHQKPPQPTFAEFAETPPKAPQLTGIGLLGRLFKSVAERRIAADVARQHSYEQARQSWAMRRRDHYQCRLVSEQEYQLKASEWSAHRDAFNQEQTHCVSEKNHRLGTDAQLMAEVLERHIKELAWPRETLVSFELSDDDLVVALDIDLPESEDMPTRTATIAKNGIRLLMTEKSSTALRKDYARHVHGIAFRLAGTVFAALPSPELIIISGYSKRVNAATGQIEDQYLYSVKVSRAGFGHLNFAELSLVDPIEALCAFEMRRVMSKTGVFTPIQPFTPAV